MSDNWMEMEKRLAKELGYKDDPVTLVNTLLEELGELSKAVNWYHNPMYTHNPGKDPPHSVEHELRDMLVAMAGIANKLHIPIEF